MKSISKVWVMENGEGHWVVTMGDHSLTCDPNELQDAIRELEAIGGSEAA